MKHEQYTLGCHSSPVVHQQLIPHLRRTSYPTLVLSLLCKIESKFQDIASEGSNFVKSYMAQSYVDEINKNRVRQ